MTLSKKFEGKQEMDNDIGLYYPELNQNGELTHLQSNNLVIRLNFLMNSIMYLLSISSFMIAACQSQISNTN